MLGILLPLKYIQKELLRKIKSLLMILIMIELNFLCESKILARLKKRTIFALTCFENKLVFPIYVPDQKLENSMDLWLVIDENKSHYMYIKDFDRVMFHKTKNKNKKYVCKSCLQCFSSKNVLTKHIEVCLSINGAQSVRLEKRTIGFKIISNKNQFHLKFMLILSVI